MTPAVLVEGLTHRYPDGHLALQGVDLRVERGERVAILGPNGSGKSTLTLHLNGILTPTTGTVEVDGIALAPGTLGEVRRKVGIVFQDPDDQLFMPTVRQDVAFGPANLGLRGDALTRRVDEALTVVGLLDVAERAPHRLSLGQRRRAALATVLAMEPAVLVLDEPSANLDPLARRELADLVAQLGLTTVVVTHDLLYAAELCERALVLDDGRVVADGPATTILEDAALLARHRLELPRLVPRIAMGANPDPSGGTGAGAIATTSLGHGAPRSETAQ